MNIIKKWTLRAVKFPVAFIVLLLLPSLLTAHEDIAASVTFLHMNDIYEIMPMDRGRAGGLARVAALKKRLLSENPNTFALLAGDLFSPSPLGTAEVEGEPLAGRQMVSVMNAVGLDFATFGNHEFDLDEKFFRQRLKESRFTWISSNVFDASGKSFPGVHENFILALPEREKGSGLKIGFFGLTIPRIRAGYAQVKKDIIRVGQEQVKFLRGKADIIVALTHLPWRQDLELASRVSGIGLILGGHDHENFNFRRGSGFVPVLKADANTRSVYIHRLFFNSTTGKLRVESQLQPITDALEDDPETAKVVRHWQTKGFAGLRKAGVQPEKVLAITASSLEGREAAIRNRPTNLGEMVALGMMRAYPEADLSLVNSGAIRIDELVPPGAITEYDLMRILPYGGFALLTEMRGSLLENILKQSEENRGTGGYLQSAHVFNVEGESRWMIRDALLQPDKWYKVVLNDFLISGGERNLGFLKKGHRELKILNADGKKEIRRLVAEYLKETFLPHPTERKP